MDLQSLSAMVRHSGYLSLNATTNQIEIKGSNFFGKLAVWIRYKTSSSYRQAVMQAKASLVQAMKLDKTYQKYFETRLIGGNISFLEEDKPISTRAVRHFIDNVKEQADHFISAENASREQQFETAKSWLIELSACDGNAPAHEMLDQKIDAMLTERVTMVAGVEIKDIGRDGINKELYQTAINDKDGIATINNKEQAQAFADRVLTELLDQRIIKAQAAKQAMLKMQLSDAGLAQAMQQKIESEITALRIVNEEQLDTHINNLILEHSAEQFDSLVDKAHTKYGIDKQLLRALNLQHSLRDYLPRSANQRLSPDSAAQQAVELLNEQAQIKKTTVDGWISKLTGTDTTADNREQFAARMNQMFEEKIAHYPGLRKQNVLLYTINHEVNQAAHAAFNDLVALHSEEQASSLIDSFISAALDQRITRAGAQLQIRLKEELAEINMPEQTGAEILAEIDSMKITTPRQLKQRIANLVLEKTANDFDALLAEAAKKYKFNRAMLANPNTKTQLMQHLSARLMASEDYKELFAIPIRSEALQQLNQQRIDVVDSWVKRWSGLSDSASGEWFKTELSQVMAAETNTLLNDKVTTMQPEDIGHQIRADILNDRDDVAAIENEDDARDIVLHKLPAVVKQRVEQTRVQRQQKLYEHLMRAGLTITDHENLETAITKMQITTIPQLNRLIHNLVVKQIDSEFDGLVEQVKKGYQFNKALASLATIKAQIRSKLDEQDHLSLTPARARAVELLEQWLATKIDAWEAIVPSRFGSEDLLKELVLQEPYTTKHQIVELQQTIEQTLAEVYSKNAAAYEALGMDAHNMLPQLARMERGNTLLNNLTTLVQQAPKPDSVFADQSWSVNGSERAVRDYATNLTEPLMHSYRQVEQLKTQVPDAIYKGARQLVIEKGATWGADIIGNTNAMYADTLKNNAAAFYNLLASPMVAQQALGTRANRMPFTFNDLVEATIANKKDINKDRKRQKAIDQLLPDAQKSYLLETITQDLARERSRIMNSSIANDVLQRSALNLLRNASIDFENKKIAFQQPTTSASPAYETTV